MPPPVARLRTANINAANKASNSQCNRMDQLSSMASQLTVVSKERDHWKNKHELLEKKYNQLLSSSMCEL